MSKNTTIRHKRSSVSGNVPDNNQIDVGEIALNLADKIIFTKDGADQVVELSNPADYLQTTAYGFDNTVDSATINKLTVGPDSADDAKLYFETGADTHTLEGREGAVDMDAWISYPSSNESNQWFSVTYGNGKFVAVSYNGSNRVMYSEDGINWTGVPSANESNQWFSVTYGDGKFVAVANSGSNRVMYSEDGITWTGATSANESNSWQSVTYGNGKFVAVSYNGSNRVMYSEDGITWTGVPSANESKYWRSVTYGAGNFVAVAESGSNQVMYSEDGINWTGGTSSSSRNYWRSVTYGNGKFVAVSYNNTNRVMVLEAPEGRSGLYYNNELIATEVNLQPLFDKVNNLSQELSSMTMVSDVIQATDAATLDFSNLPDSAGGLASGKLYRDSDTIRVVL